MKRTLALGAAWTASAAAAVGLGFLAVSLVDASADPGTSPVAATTPAAEASTTPSPVPSATSALGQSVTPGGTIYTDCSSGSPVNAAVPAAGWSVDDSSAAGETEFRSGDRRIEVHVSCGADGVISVTRDDSSRRGTPSPSTASSTAGSDDHGGHGGDDPAGDDSSGRSGGGHGRDG